MPRFTGRKARVPARLSIASNLKFFASTSNFGSGEARQNSKRQKAGSDYRKPKNQIPRKSPI